MLALFLERLLALDIGWMVSVLLNNWLWAFIFLAAGYFIFGPKRIVPSFFLVVLMIWTSLDFSSITGLGIVEAKFLLISMFAFMLVGVLAENSPRLSKHFFFFNSAAYFFVLIIYNLFLR